MKYRLAESKDVFSLMKLYQLAVPEGFKDPVFLDYKKLLAVLNSKHSIWIVADNGKELCAVLSILMDSENKLSKINRLYIDPNWKDNGKIIKESIPHLIKYLKEKDIEAIYMTSRTFSLEQQAMALDMGFKMIGIFPGAMTVDPSQVNGLTAYFFDSVLTERRFDNFALHSIVQPFYEITRKECGLPPLETAKPISLENYNFEKLPELELIYAPLYVGNRFAKLEERKSLSIHFYPFSRPNAFITDAEGKIEIYVKIMSDSRMATIIGERLSKSVNPTELYNKVSLILNKRNVNYIEVINDAADSFGIECIAKAGFLPCAYFPCLKNQGDKRRDYVVLAKSFERQFLCNEQLPEVNQKYLEFLKEYYKLENLQYLDKLKPC